MLGIKISSTLIDHNEARRATRRVAEGRASSADYRVSHQLSVNGRVTLYWETRQQAKGLRHA